MFQVGEGEGEEGVTGWCVSPKQMWACVIKMYL